MLAIPIADGLHSGKLNIVDYFKLQNINADTEMRNALAKTSRSPSQTQRLA